MIRNGWYCCPICGKHIQKIEQESVIHGTPLYCKLHHAAFYPDIWMGRELGADEPFPIDEK